MLEAFPTDWRTALLLVPHPDDPEYGCAAAVAKWTSHGKTVRYALACRGEVGIAGMPPEEAGPLREAEQLRSAAMVGVHDVQFWDFPDSQIRDTPELRAKIADTITALAPDLVLTVYSGPEWAPGHRTSATTSSSRRRLRRHMTRSPNRRGGCSRTGRK